MNRRYSRINTAPASEDFLAGSTMPQDNAYELMRSTLEAILPSVEACARGAKSAAAKKALMNQIEQIRAALKAAKQSKPDLNNRVS